MTKAWQITWKHKVLWLFGILLSFGQIVNLGNNGVRLFSQGNILPPDLVHQLAGLFASLSFWVIFPVSIFALLVALLFFSTIGQIGVIKGVSLADRSDEPLTVGQLWNASKPSFWRVFGISLITGFFFFFIFLAFFGLLVAGLIFALPARGAGSSGQVGVILAAGLFCLIPVLCLVVLVSIVIGPILTQGLIAIIVDNLGILAGLAKGWQVVKSNVGSVILIVVLNYIIGVLAGFVVGIPSLVVALPLVMLAGGTGSSQTLIYLALACLCAAIPFVLLLESISTVFVHAIWTLTYLRLTATPQVAATPAMEDAHAA